MDHAARRERLRATLIADGLDLLLVAPTVNVTYLSGFTGDSSWLIVSRYRDLLVSDDRFREQIERECPGLPAHFRPHDRKILEELGLVIHKIGGRRIGLETQVTLGEYEALREMLPQADFLTRSGRVEALRAIKDADEISMIRVAIRVAQRAFQTLLGQIRPSDTEKDAADALESYVRRAGGTRTAFPTIIGVGPNSALPHCPPSERRLEESGWFLADWGACASLYHSDMTRVVQLPDCRLPNEIPRIYAITREAQRRAIAAIRPGVTARAVDEAARRYIEEAGYGEYFNHGLGHGIGLQIHEAPAIRRNTSDVLQAGMVVTIEPGIYLPGIGGVRIEDDVWITESGPEILTSIPRDDILTMD